jgi:hypothetical protein
LSIWGGVPCGGSGWCRMCSQTPAEINCEDEWSFSGKLLFKLFTFFFRLNGVPGSATSYHGGALFAKAPLVALRFINQQTSERTKRVG